MMIWGFQKYITKQLNLKISFSAILRYDNLYCPILSRPEPTTCPDPAICRPVSVACRHAPVTHCHPEPQCAVANIPKRDNCNSKSCLQLRVKFQVRNATRLYHYEMRR